MQLTKPDIKRVHVTVYEKGVRGTKTFTVYDSSVDEVAKKLQSAIGPKKKKAAPQQPAGRERHTARRAAGEGGKHHPAAAVVQV